MTSYCYVQNVMNYSTPIELHTTKRTGLRRGPKERAPPERLKAGGLVNRTVLSHSLVEGNLAGSGDVVDVGTGLVHKVN